MVLTVSFALSSVIGLSCHRRPQVTTCELDASVETSGPHDFAVRARAIRQERTRVHRIPPRVDDVAQHPLWGRTAGVLEVICPTREVKYFRCGDWTGKFAKAVLICPSGWVASSSRTELIAPAHANRQNRTAGISEITP